MIKICKYMNLDKLKQMCWSAAKARTDSHVMKFEEVEGKPLPRVLYEFDPKD